MLRTRGLQEAKQGHEYGQVGIRTDTSAAGDMSVKEGLIRLHQYGRAGRWIRDGVEGLETAIGLQYAPKHASSSTASRLEDRTMAPSA